MRLIDADSLKLKRGDFAITSNPEMNRFNRMFVDLFNKEVDNAPTLDAVPVVRCENCLYWHKAKEICDVFYTETPYDAYCYFWLLREVQNATD